MDWKVHHTPYGYMDRDGFLKPTTQFYNVCGASTVKNQKIFSDGNDSHFYDCIPMHMERRNIQPFILKAGKSVNAQPNDNGPNSKLKPLYNEAKYEWMLKHGTKMFYLNK